MSALVRLARIPHSSAQVEEAMRFAGLILAVNSTMAVVKIGVGILSGSHAILASSLYSINDVLSAIAIGASLRVAQRNPSQMHPYGYGKAEFIAVGVVSLSIAFAVCSMFIFSVVDIIKGVPGPPHYTALTLAAVSMVVSWTLSRKGHRLAAKLESPALDASSDHHHADAEGSLAAVIGVAGAMMGFHVLDRFVAVFETLHIVALSGRLLGRSVKGLMDTSIPSEDISLIKKACLRVHGVDDVPLVRTRQAGCQTWVDLAISVSPSLTVADAHAVGTHVRSAVGNVLGPSVFTQVRFQGPDYVISQPGPGGSPHG